jgi:hypothetical protein
MSVAKPSFLPFISPFSIPDALEEAGAEPLSSPLMRLRPLPSDSRAEEAGSPERKRPCRRYQLLMSPGGSAIDQHSYRPLIGAPQRHQAAIQEREWRDSASPHPLEWPSLEIGGKAPAAPRLPIHLHDDDWKQQEGQEQALMDRPAALWLPTGTRMILVAETVEQILQAPKEQLEKVLMAPAPQRPSVLVSCIAQGAVSLMARTVQACVEQQILPKSGELSRSLQKTCLLCNRADALIRLLQHLEADPEVLLHLVQPRATSRFREVILELSRMDIRLPSSLTKQQLFALFNTAGRVLFESVEDPSSARQKAMQVLRWILLSHAVPLVGAGPAVSEGITGWCALVDAPTQRALLRTLGRNHPIPIDWGLLLSRPHGLLQAPGLLALMEQGAPPDLSATAWCSGAQVAQLLDGADQIRSVQLLASWLEDLTDWDSIVITIRRDPAADAGPPVWLNALHWILLHAHLLPDHRLEALLERASLQANALLGERFCLPTDGRSLWSLIQGWSAPLLRWIEQEAHHLGLHQAGAQLMQAALAQSSQTVRQSLWSMLLRHGAIPMQQPLWLQNPAFWTVLQNAFELHALDGTPLPGSLWPLACTLDQLESLALAAPPAQWGSWSVGHDARQWTLGPRVSRLLRDLMQDPSQRERVQRLQQMLEPLTVMPSLEPDGPLSLEPLQEPETPAVEFRSLWCTDTHPTPLDLGLGSSPTPEPAASDSERWTPTALFSPHGPPSRHSFTTVQSTSR